MSEISRRGFLRAGTGSALVAMLPGGRMLAEEQDAAGQMAVGSGEKIRFASIGLGIEGSSLLRAAVTIPNAECVAVCDLYDGRHTLGKEIAGPNIKVTRRYQEILEDKSIQAVIVATPDHWHKQVTVDAIKAGKDVHCEKPMSHTIAEGEEMVRAVRSSKNFVQVGSQRVSSAVFKKAKEMYDSGVIGEVHQVELQLGRNSPGGAWEYPPPLDLSPATLDWETWQGNAPKKAFDPLAFARWRCWHEYGTGMAGDLMVHLLTGFQFVTGINAVPDKAYSTGGIVRWKDGRNMPDMMVTQFEYGSVPVTVRLTLGTETPEMTRIMGPKGIIEVTNETVHQTRVIPQIGMDRSPAYGINGFPAAMRAEYIKQWTAEHEGFLKEHPLDETMAWSGPSWDDLRPHLVSFFTAVQTRQPVVEDVVFGHHAAAACHMANTSHFEKKVVLKQG